MLLGYRVDGLWARCRARLLAWQGLRIGRQVQIHAGVTLRFGMRSGSSIGDGSILYRGVRMLATAGGAFTLGRNSHLAPDAYLLVGAQQLHIGDDVAIGPGLMLFCESNGVRDGALFRQQYVRGSVRIGNDVFIGARVTILPGTVIGDRVAVAAHSVVRGQLPSGWLYGGCPARPLRRLDADTQDAALQGADSVDAGARP